VPIRDLALHFLALLVYPGALLTIAVGAAAEAACAGALGGAAPRAALLAPAGQVRTALRRPGTLRLTVPLLAVLAATQLAIPLNPISPVARSLLVAAIALAAAMWLGWVASWTPVAARATLLAQVCWLIALVTPALISQSLRPQALGAVVVPAQLPLKVAAGLLALLCLPGLLRLAPAEEPATSRLFLWLPLCGLLTSVFVPPGPEDLSGAAWFMAITLAVAAAAIAMAVLAARFRAAADLYPRLLAPAAAVVLAIGVVTSALT